MSHHEATQRAPNLALVVALAVLWIILMTRLPRTGGVDRWENPAIATLIAIHSGQAEYATSCAHGGYAVDLADMVKPARGEAQGFVSPDLNVNGVVRSQYVFRLARNAAPNVRAISSPADTCNNSVNQPVSSYFASAEP